MHIMDQLAKYCNCAFKIVETGKEEVRVVMALLWKSRRNCESVGLVKVTAHASQISVASSVGVAWASI
jgi:hypothetical protein